MKAFPNREKMCFLCFNKLFCSVYIVQWILCIIISTIAPLTTSELVINVQNQVRFLYPVGIVFQLKNWIVIFFFRRKIQSNYWIGSFVKFFIRFDKNMNINRSNGMPTILVSIQSANCKENKKVFFFFGCFDFQVFHARI